MISKKAGKEEKFQALSKDVVSVLVYGFRGS